MYRNVPYIEISEERQPCASGWDAINLELADALSKINKNKVVVVVECHHGTFEEVNFNALKRGLKPNASCKSSHIFKEVENIRLMVRECFNQSPLLNQYTELRIDDYFDENKKEALQDNIEFIEEGIVLLFGIGASLIWEADLLVYADMSQWEIQQRFKRNDVDNIGLQGSHYSFEEQYLLAFFNDWPLCNELRKKVLPKCDYYLETNNWIKPKLVSGKVLRSGLQQASRQPFKLAPFFDPLLWDQPDQAPNEESLFDWCYNCVPDEDNLLFKTRDILFEVPLLSLIACYPESLLGRLMVKKFGERLPIHLDFIDTQETGKTKYRFLPKHPQTHPTREQFYYFLETGEKSKIKFGHFQLDKNASLDKAKIIFKTQDQYLQNHDFLSIPNGVATRIGAQVIALFISNSSGKFIFEINPKKYLEQNSAAIKLSIEAKTNSGTISLHHTNLEKEEVSLEEVLLPDLSSQLDIQRLWFKESLSQDTQAQIQVINLIRGDNILLEDPDHQFPSQLIKRGETFIIPASIRRYKLKTLYPGSDQIAILKVSGKLN